MAHHGSIDSDAPAPSSAQTLEVVLGIMSAGRGHIYFAPDLIGLGETSKLPQAYLVTQDTSTAAQDMRWAVRDYFQQKMGKTIPRDQVIAGASQGGFSSFASFYNPGTDVDVTGFFAADGPYDIYQTISSNLDLMAGLPLDSYSQYENLKYLPGHLRTIMNSYRAYQGLKVSDAEVFQPDGSIKPDFLQSWRQGGWPEIRQHLGLNNFVRTTQVYDSPNANVSLFHFTTDVLVPSQNTVDMISFLSGKNHSLKSVSRGDCHEDSIFIKLILAFSKSPLKTHVACGIFFLDKAVADLP